MPHTPARSKLFKLLKTVKNRWVISTGSKVGIIAQTSVPGTQEARPVRIAAPARKHPPDTGRFYDGGSRPGSRPPFGSESPFAAVRTAFAPMASERRFGGGTKESNTASDRRCSVLLGMAAPSHRCQRERRSGTPSPDAESIPTRSSGRTHDGQRLDGIIYCSALSPEQLAQGPRPTRAWLGFPQSLCGHFVFRFDARELFLQPVEQVFRWLSR